MLSRQIFICCYTRFINTYFNPAQCIYHIVRTQFYVSSLEMFDLKTKYDESDNLAVRMTRSITDKVGQLFGEYIIKTCFLLGRFSGHNMYRQCLNMIDFGPLSYQVQFLDVNFLNGTLCRHVRSPVLVMLIF